MAGPQQPPASPPARRLTRPGWRDPRLLLGLVLVAGSVALGSTLVASAARTVPVYVAARPLVPGDVVDARSLRVVDVRLGSAQEAYLRADEPLPEGLVATGVVGEGELVARSTVAPEADLGLRPVAIEPAGALPDGLGVGSRVDLWYVPEARPGGVSGVTGAVAGAGGTDGAAGAGHVAAAEPVLLVGDLTVADVSEPGGGFSVAPSVTVHVLVPVDDLPAVLAALASDGSVEVVLVPGSGA